MSYNNSMSEEQILKFNKYVAKHTKKVMIDKVIEVDRHRTKLKVRVCSVIPPNGRWGNFRVNVKVLESMVEMAVRDDAGFIVRDNNGDIVYKYVPRRLRRSEVNWANNEIRRRVGYRVEEMIEFFGIESWRVNVEKVNHS